MTRTLRVQLVIAASAALLGGCKSGTDSEPVGPAAKLVAASDTTGSAVAGPTVETLLTVQVVDANNRGVAGATVTWATVDGGAVTPAQSLTDDRGRAQATWRLTSRVGSQRVIAQTLTPAGAQGVQFRYIVAAGATASIGIAPEGGFMVPGETRQLSVQAADAFGNPTSDRPVVWASSNLAVASVDSRGKVTAVGAGTASVTATIEGKIAAVQVRVTNGDLFDAPTLGLYTHYSDVPATWSVQNGAAVATGGGKQSHMVRNDVRFRDGWVEAEIDRADEGGLVLRFVDPNNLYLLAIRDDGSLLGFRNIEIFKRVGGQFQLITFGININWPRGTVKTVRFDAVGSTLRAYVDGVLLVEASDASIQGTGAIGMRYHDVPEDIQTDMARYLTLRWSGS
ncbi:MAG TPA: Ig-like domain-containing protein [Longimicrobium sp.]|nr:Ig-like domain-containing protein [Longimicrobium sp.]